MSARRERRSDRSAIDNVLDDLLASDDEETSRKKTPLTKAASPFKPSPLKPASTQRKLTAKASDVEFYSNLKSLGGEEIEESEDDELSDEAVKRLAAEIGDLDDLDNDLFSGFGGDKKKVQSKPTGTTSKAKKLTKTSSIHSSYDLDDPLAGLGLSDEDFDASINKKKSSKKNLLTRTLSHENAKIVPGIGDESDEGKLSQSLEKGDPFLTSLTSVSTRTRLKEQQNSEDHLATNLNTSDSDISPRQFTKQKKGKLRRKGSVGPSGTSDADTDVDASINKPSGLLLKQSNENISITNNKGKGKPASKKKEEDLFGDSDALPGMSDEESSPKKVKPVKQINADDIPAEKATKALDNLLNSSPSRSNKKHEPTMLEKIMAGKSTASKAEEKTGYSPSVVSDRPTTAPSRRSVTFADQLGIDLDGSITDKRPITAPESKQFAGRRKKSDIDLDSDFDETTKEWLSLSKSKQESPVNKDTKPKKKAVRPKKNDDWLGLGDDLTDKYNLESSGEFFTPKNGNADKEMDMNNKQTEEKSKDVKEEKLTVEEKSTLPWESPSRRVGAKPGSRHRTPEKEKAKEKEDLDESLLSPLDPVKHVKASSEFIVDSNTEGKKAEDEFLNLLKKNKGKKEERKEEKQPTVIKQANVKESLSIDIVSIPSLPSQKQETPAIPNIEVNKDSNVMLNRHEEIVRQDKKEVAQPAPVPSVNAAAQDSSVMQLLQQLLQQQVLSSTPVGTQDNTFRSRLPPPDITNLQTIKEEVMKDLNAQHQEEFNAAKWQFERDKTFLESELKGLQEKVLKMEESKFSSTTDYSKVIRELEATVRKLELERDQLLLSLESLKQRHKSEMESLESSHKTRVGFMEDSYKRREQQILEEAHMEKDHFDEKLKAFEVEKGDLMNGFKKKSEFMEKNKMTEINRLKNIHEMAVQDLVREHSEQMEHVRLLKEQEVAAAVSAFSHTKSLQTLMQEVQDSTKKVGNLQMKIDAAHKSKTDDHEMTLKSKDEYLKNHENRLVQQERGNDEERQRLQTLISKMEIQLKEQTRQIEQDKWKLTQEENRFKTMQASFEEEKRVMMEQIMQDRDQISKAREEMLVDQRKIIAECYEEKRKVENDRARLLLLKKETSESTRLDRSPVISIEADIEATLSRYQNESATLSSRISYLKQEEHEIKIEKENIARERKQFDKERDELCTAGEVLKKRSKEIEECAIEAKRVHDEGVQAIEEAQLQRSELIDANNQYEVKVVSLKQQENSLREEQSKHELDRKVFERERETNKCYMCKSPITPGHFDPRNPYFSHPMHTAFPQNLNPMFASLPSGFQQNTNYMPLPQQASHSPYMQRDPNTIQYVPSPDTNNNMTNEAMPYNTIQNTTPTIENPQLLENPTLSSEAGPPPDLLMNSFEFKRAMRRYSSAKEKDDTFFEEETRFLKGLHQKRLTR